MDSLMERIVGWYVIGGYIFMACYVVFGVPFYVAFVR